jgi:hypothetical protein
MALSDVFGFQPSFSRLAWMIGETTSKTHYWFNVFGHPHVVAFLCLLERLPDHKRQEILNLYCRELPTLDHSRLAHDPKGLPRLLDYTQIRAQISGAAGQNVAQAGAASEGKHGAESPVNGGVCRTLAQADAMGQMERAKGFESSLEFFDCL